MVKDTSESTPFFLKSSFGGASDLRGYPSGRYRDRMMYAMQAEYRWQIRDRWILTGFAGVGEVAERFSNFGEHFLPAAGVGARYVLSEKHRVSLSTDLAVGNDGVEFYFGVGEAF
jgi:outer membrane translocation and assembly module TamA